MAQAPPVNFFLTKLRLSWGKSFSLTTSVTLYGGVQDGRPICPERTQPGPGCIYYQFPRYWTPRGETPAPRTDWQVTVCKTMMPNWIWCFMNRRPKIPTFANPQLGVNAWYPCSYSFWFPDQRHILANHHRRVPYGTWIIERDDTESTICAKFDTPTLWSFIRTWWLG